MLVDGQGGDIGYQYLSNIFYYSEVQKKLASDIIHQLQDMGYNKVATQIKPVTTFWKAEDYHQKYYNKNVPYDTIIVMNYKPPFRITNKILELAQDVGHELGLMSGAKLDLPPIILRKNNQIKTIQSSLAIEDNLLKAHKLLMQGLIQDNGIWRSSGVGIFKGNKIAHIAPPANRVLLLMNKLFDFINKNNDIAWLIKACIFHYELEFIHPFSDGNGRIGRHEYYNILAKCDSAGESTLFIEFMAAQILEALKLYNSTTVSQIKTPFSRLEFSKTKLNQNWFSRKDYKAIHKEISTSTASRDLNFGIQQGILIYKGIKNQTYYKFS
ncbi:unnamed protein product [Rotaria magnacalcarata]|uniref:peptide-methionine (S)-S-oxide reductase n=1 Tax=Rotaria magnacalcarata TaxID=392030 RepID=A0A816ZY25_9BILA|nr:unnamed protein product [Rotaria magnacalcarata]